MSGTAPVAARQSARIQQRVEQREAVAKQEEAKASSSSEGSQKNGGPAKSRDIQLVQTLIERCLQLYMPQKDVVTTLQAQAKIEPGFTRLVWNKLEEQNKEFFKAYYLRLKLKEHVVMFNYLLEQQQAMLSQLHSSWVQAVPTLMTQASGGVPCFPGMQMGPSHGSMRGGQDPAGMAARASDMLATPGSGTGAHGSASGAAPRSPGAAAGGTAAVGGGGPGDIDFSSPGGGGASLGMMEVGPAAGPGTAGCPLPLSPVDPASLLGQDDVLLIDSSSRELNQGGSNELLRPLDDSTFGGSGLGSSAHHHQQHHQPPHQLGDNHHHHHHHGVDLIHIGDELMEGLGMQGLGVHGGSGEDAGGAMMLDTVDGQQGTLDHHKFSMSDLKAWGEHEFGDHHEGPIHGLEDDGGLGGSPTHPAQQGPTHSGGGHDSSSHGGIMAVGPMGVKAVGVKAEADRLVVGGLSTGPLLQQDSSMSLPGLPGDGGQLHGVPHGHSLPHDSDEVTAPFGGGDAALTDEGMPDLPGLDLGAL